MDLFDALRPEKLARIALAGSGGKTTALFQLARRFPPPVIVTTTTHFGLDQLASADRHFVIRDQDDLLALEGGMVNGINLLSGLQGEDERVLGLSSHQMDRVRDFADRKGVPLLIEADGSRRLPVKAPAEYEPAIPDFADMGVVVVGLSGCGKPLTPEWVHRPERFSALTGLAPGDRITPGALVSYLLSAEGGLKNIPSGARRVVLFNQADTPYLREQAEIMQSRLLKAYDQVSVAELRDEAGLVFSTWQPVAGIILAAGESRRFQEDHSGQLKQLLDWQGEPFVHRVAHTALQSGLDPVVVVSGAQSSQVQAAVEDLAVRIVENPGWQAGQSTSLQVGLGHLPQRASAAIFLLADQPQIPVELVQSLVVQYAHTLAPIVAPRIGGRRGNPVLFDRSLFPELLALEGDQGGRALFSSGSHPVSWLDWEDDSILFDIDTWQDYADLSERKASR